MHRKSFAPVALLASACLLHSPPQPAVAQDVRNETLKILAGDGAAGDQFGFSAAISGTTGIVGASDDDDNGAVSGSAYLFDLTTGAQIAKLLPGDGAAGDEFGYSVAISGTTAIVGAYRDDDNGKNSGSAYLFDVATGTQIAKLLPRDGAADEWFGWSVAISGGTAVVGARHDWGIGVKPGSAYLFDISNPNAPVQLAKLLPDDGMAGDHFGVSVAISGATCIVGAHGNDDNGSSSGSAYLFDATTGTQIAKLLPSDGAAFDNFGYSVAISEATCIVSAHWDDDNGTGSGSAYLFDVTTGTQIAKLLPSDGTAADFFGVSVAISGATAIVGAWWDDTYNGTNSGSAYLFDVTTAMQIAKLLPSDGAADDEFGLSVAISGATAIAGARFDDDNGTDSGSAYVFDARGLTPTLTLDFSGDCPGAATFTVTEATPAGLVAIVYGFGDGPTTIPTTVPCAGTILDVGNPNLGSRIIVADADGVAVLNTNLPTIACDRVRVQALDLANCETSSVVRP